MGLEDRWDGSVCWLVLGRGVMLGRTCPKEEILGDWGHLVGGVLA